MKSAVVILALCAVAFAQDMAMGNSMQMPKGEDPMHSVLIQYAKDMNYTMCYVGARDMAMGMLTSDSMSPAICEYPGSKCVRYTGVMKGFDGFETQIEYGDCVPPMAEAYYTCAAARNSSAGLGVLDNCQTTFCEGDLCNVFTLESNTTCDKMIPDTDLNFMPGLTMREMFHEMEHCTEKLYSGYPYMSHDMCKDNYNEALTCTAGVLLKAINSPCMSMWDWLPGFRSMVNSGRVYLFALQMYDLETFWGGMVQYLNIDHETAAYIEGYFDELSCPEPGKVPQCIEDAWMWAKTADVEMEVNNWLTSMGIDVQDIGMMGMEGVCKEGYWTATMKASLDYMWNWYAAENRMETCEAVNTYFIRSVNAWSHMCDDMKVYPALLAMYGEENRDSVDVIAKMLMIWDDIYMSYKFPNCEPATTNGSPLECEKYYDSTTACGIRKAWLCDYADWKMGFLADWLMEYEQFEINNILTPAVLDAPACDNFDMTDLCKNRGMQRCSTMPVTGCYSCYCMDHEYKDLHGLAEIWRKDYLGWRHVMKTYKKAFASATCREAWTMEKPMDNIMDMDPGFGMDMNKMNGGNMRR